MPVFWYIILYSHSCTRPRYIMYSNILYWNRWGMQCESVFVIVVKSETGKIVDNINVESASFDRVRYCMLARSSVKCQLTRRICSNIICLWAYIIMLWLRCCNNKVWIKRSTLTTWYDRLNGRISDRIKLCTDVWLKNNFNAHYFWQWCI